jgi:hypothetical protein
MKNLKVLIATITLILFSTSTVFAITETTAKHNLRTEMICLLGDSSSIEFESKTLKANVSFIINEKNQVVILSVDSNNKSFDAYVKYKLNYKSVMASSITKGKIYIMPLKLKK